VRGEVWVSSQDGSDNYLSQCWRQFLPKRRRSMAMERLANFSDEVTERQSNVRMEEERVERGT